MGWCLVGVEVCVCKKRRLGERVMGLKVCVWRIGICRDWITMPGVPPIRGTGQQN